jgi:hypothetical protein
MIACAFEKNFTREIALEIDSQPTNGTAYRSGVHDASIAGLLNLMIDDFEAAFRPCAV